ncbi:hypothetical protein LEP1GSC194_0389 [Leptospira alstonii serovar Sichuan str. 79601]|uniref:Transposase DDE domain protein n=1 Tax=Leptospira alstonii serovar Sichuan str. 79601 TaxID=1218565 RepID=M6CVX3_9LEPT|nr:hypothetical protein LEP1GSC194_0389 [Leptospira alstonii serovar Sichuan str. 79601]
MVRNFLKGKEGDRINVLLSAAGCNFSKLLRAFFLFWINFLFFCTRLFQISFSRYHFS